MTRYLIALVLAVLAMAPATAAQAHAELKSSNPAAGAALDAAPKQIELVFSDAVQLPDGDAVTVTGPDGSKWAVTQAQAVGNTITATVDGNAATSGAYTMAWQAKADDGDVISGTVAFTLTVAATSSAPTSSAPTSSVTMSAPVSNAPTSTAPAESGGLPAWVWIVLGLVVLVGVILLVRRRKA